jgi:hypothetical protein
MFRRRKKKSFRGARCGGNELQKFNSEIQYRNLVRRNSGGNNESSSSLYRPGGDRFLNGARNLRRTNHFRGGYEAR